MSDLVLNEWLWSDLRGENGKSPQEESLRLLGRIQETIADRIVVVLNSPFARKFWNLSRDASTPAQRLAVLRFKALFVDSKKCIQLDPVVLPDIGELQRYCKQDDWYLIQAHQFLGSDSLIVTTDQPLIHALQKYDLQCSHRDSWLRDYLR